MTTSIILDIETLSRRPDALVLEVGLIAFNRADFVPFDCLELFPGFFPQIQSGRHLCAETIAFHTKQGTLPTQVGDQCPAVAMKALANFIASHKPHRVWIQGPDFDRPILENLCQQHGLALPWEYWRTADSRTAWNLAFPGVKHDKRPHRAIADCKATLHDLAKSLIALNRTDAA